jgi:hypothetical protein
VNHCTKRVLQKYEHAQFTSNSKYKRKIKHVNIFLVIKQFRNMDYGKRTFVNNSNTRLHPYDMKSKLTVGILAST